MPYSSLVCEFGGFENVLRDAGIRAIPDRDGTDANGLGSMAIHLAHHCFSFNI